MEEIYIREIVGDVLNRVVFTTAYSIIMYSFVIILLACVGIDVDFTWSIVIWGIALGIALLLILKKDLLVLRKMKKETKKTV